MDFSDIYEEELEKERSKVMTIEIAGMNLEIPTELVQERMDRMYIDTMEENISQIKRDGEAFYKCFLSDGISQNDFEKKLIERIDDIVDLFRPN